MPPKAAPFVASPRRRACVASAAALVLGLGPGRPHAQPAATPAQPEPVTVLDLPPTADDPGALPPGQGSVFFVGTATVVMRFGAITLLTDPNFLHRGEHAHLGYGLNSPRLTDPALEIDRLPPLDAVLVSHFHGDHFDQVAEAKLPRGLPILTTPHGQRQLRERGFTAARGLETWQSLELRKGRERLRVTAMPGRHGPFGLALALPPVMGSLIEWLGADDQAIYRVYVSGDTLVHDELREIPRRFRRIDLALLHLGGTRIFGVLVTMDAEQGVQALQLLNPDRAVPIHYDDYPVFKSPLADFRRAVERAGWSDRVRYLARGETLRFQARAVAAAPAGLPGAAAPASAPR